MSHSDSLPPGDCDPAPNPLVNGHVPLPSKGEYFSGVHYAAIAAQMRPSLNGLFFEYRKLRQAGIEECDLVGWVLTRAMGAGPVHTSAERLVRKLTGEAVGDAQRAHQRFFRLRTETLDDPDISLAACSVAAAPDVPDPAADTESTELAAAAVCWLFPDVDPQAAAVFALWVGRTGEHAPSIRDLREKYPSLSEKIRNLYRRWKRYFTLPQQQASELFWLLRNHPRLPLCYAHFYFAAGRDGRRAGNLLEVFCRTIRRDPDCLGEAVITLRADARRESKQGAKLWRDTEEAYGVTRRLAAQCASTLTEVF